MGFRKLFELQIKTNKYKHSIASETPMRSVPKGYIELIIFRHVKTIVEYI